MESIIEFLKSLSAHNDRPWFNAHKDEYLAAKSRFDSLVEELIAGVREFDPSIGNLTVADCTWRIYRDTRFSKDKRPYKNYMGCYFAPQGKKGPYSGYYFQIGIDEYGEANGMLATGNYYTEPEVLKILREDIEMDNAEALESAIGHAKGFALDDEQKLKKVPRGFDADKPYSDYLKYKNFCLIKYVPAKYLLDKGFKKKLLKDFSSTAPFLGLLNRAIEYSLENND